MNDTDMHAAAQANDRLTRALLDLATQGERVRCSDPIDHARWTSDNQRDRQTAMAWCAGCPVIDLCGQAADERGEKHHVWGGVDLACAPGQTAISG
jgi:Transcription factor WhiB